MDERSSTAPPPSPPSSTAGEIARSGLDFFKRLPWEKATIWAIFLFLLYMLRAFFDIIFITFVISYMAKNLVDWVNVKVRKRPRDDWLRKFLVFAFYIVFVGLLTNLAILVIPRLFREVHELVRLLVPNPVQTVSQRARPPLLPYGVEVSAEALIAEAPELFDPRRFTPEGKGVSGGGGPAGGKRESASKRSSAAAGAFPLPETEVPATEGIETPIPEPPRAGEVYRINIREPFKAIVHSLFKGEEDERIRAFLLNPEILDRLEKYLGQEAAVVINRIRLFTLDLWVFVFHFLLSILFSLILLLDIPKIGRKIQLLHHSRLRNFYDEIAPSVVGFAEVMGRAFQAQAIIALCNTFLTGVGLWWLGIPNLTLLLVVVFFCSFIPVLGVILSTVPIGIIAIQQGGFPLLLQVIFLVIVVHTVEAYVLNPKIFGEVLKIHPLAVLIILLVAEHNFGLWGLLLGLPLANYVITHVIFANLADPSEEAAFKEIAGVTQSAPPPSVEEPMPQT